jgi:asparagine synthase (glutamine-hydrolysing)
MCGLLGTVSTANLLPGKGRFLSALALMEHRGPDDSNTYFVHSGAVSIALGHNRLSIIDLSPSGRQPMTGENRRYSLVFNGEIYNYRELRNDLCRLGVNFSTQTDTEVLLAAWEHWGPDCLRRLVGMFAFAIHDSLTSETTLVRDGFGIKPLYFMRGEQSVSFASEIQPLLELGPSRPQLNKDVMANYLLNSQADRKADTFFEGLERLPPGHLMEISFRDGKFVTRTKSWWSPKVTQSTSASFDQAAEELRSLFLGAVELHMRSDVPLGFALSGGIDSSALVGSARFLEPDLDIHTFSFVAKDSPFNEELWIDKANSFFRGIPHKVELDSSDLGADFDDLIRTQGEPFGSASIYAQYAVFRSAKEAGITVTLDGQGADELLAGYHGYPSSRAISLLETGQLRQLMGFVRDWSRWPGRSSISLVRAIVGETFPSGLQRFFRESVLKNSVFISQKWLVADLDHPLPVRLERIPEAKGRRLAETLKYELTSAGLESLLRYNDRNSMRWSVESRVPFLSIPLADFALSLPEKYLLSGKGETKSVFREAMRGLVPDEILTRRDKIGFRPPEGRWLRELSDQLFTCDLFEGLESLEIVNVQEVREGFRRQLESGGELSPEIWRFVNAGKWARVFLR